MDNARTRARVSEAQKNQVDALSRWLYGKQRGTAMVVATYLVKLSEQSNEVILEYFKRGLVGDELHNKSVRYEQTHVVKTALRKIESVVRQFAPLSAPVISTAVRASIAYAMDSLDEAGKEFVEMWCSDAESKQQEANATKIDQPSSDIPKRSPTSTAGQQIRPGSFVRRSSINGSSPSA